MADDSRAGVARMPRPVRLRLAERWHRHAPLSPAWLRTVLAIEGLIVPSECRLLFALAREVRDGAIVEIGSYRGRSTAALAFGARTGAGTPVHAVDPHREGVGALGAVYGGDDARAWRANVARAGVAAITREVLVPSLDAAARWRGPIGLLFVDGDHDLGAVRADVAAWAPFVAATGRIALHDAVRPGLGPTRVAAEMAAAGEWRIERCVADTVVLRRADVRSARDAGGTLHEAGAAAHRICGTVHDAGGGARRAVLVTGAASGIGRATARSALARGLTVFGAARTPEQCAALEAEGIVPLRMDVASAADIESARSIVRERLEGASLIGLVTAAGIGAVGPLEETPPEVLRRLLEVNVVGTAAVTRAFLPLLRSAGGRIVLVGSLSGRLAVPYLGAYSASKWALEALADALRREVGPSGVDVVLLEPGAVRTAAARRAWSAPVDLPDAPYGTPYRRFLARWRASVESGLPPERVGEVVADLLTARHVPARVVVAPRGAWRARVMSRLPAAIQDRCLVRDARRR